MAGYYLRTVEQNKKHSEACKNRTGKWERTKQHKQAMSERSKGIRIKDISGKKFNRLTVIKFSHSSKYRQTYWECICQCGKNVVVAKNNLICGNVKSCGCLAKEIIAEWNKENGKSGSENPNWKGGLSNNPYPKKFNTKLKFKIRQRDKFTCQICGKTEGQERQEINRVLCVNHIDFNKNNCEEDNLNTLCLKCNLMVNFDREKWTNYFKQAVKFLA